MLMVCFTLYMQIIAYNFAGLFFRNPSMSQALKAETDEKIIKSRSRVKGLLGCAVMLLFVIAMGIYGLVAIDAGYVNFKGTGNAQILAARQQQVKDAEARKDVHSFAELNEQNGVMVATFAKIISPKFAYGQNGLSEPLIHYASAPKKVSWMLALHNIMGGILMLIGAMQFVPVFRRRYPKWHRISGLLYITCATVGMLAAIYYMSHTPLSLMYDGFTFTFGVWFLAIGVLLSVWISIYHLIKKEIAQHQAWMAISFGLLLTAPLQRIMWVILGLMNPGMRQLESEYAASSWLIPASFCVAYSIFTWNRFSQVRKADAVLIRQQSSFPRWKSFGKGLATFTLVLISIEIVITAIHFIAAPGLLAYVGNNSRLIPAGVIFLDTQIIVDHTIPRLIFAVATVTGLIVGLSVMWKTFIQSQNISLGTGWLIAAMSFITGGVMTSWGWALGMPSFATLAGGATWLFGGLASIAFAGLLSWALIKQDQLWIQEWSLFAIALLMGAPFFYVLFPIFSHVGIPSFYEETGHVFRLASYGQWFLLLFVFVYCVYNKATIQRFAK